ATFSVTRWRVTGPSRSNDAAILRGIELATWARHALSPPYVGSPGVLPARAGRAVRRLRSLLRDRSRRVPRVRRYLVVAHIPTPRSGVRRGRRPGGAGRRRGDSGQQLRARRRASPRHRLARAAQAVRDAAPRAAGQRDG